MKNATLLHLKSLLLQHEIQSWPNGQELSSSSSLAACIPLLRLLPLQLATCHSLASLTFQVQVTKSKKHQRQSGTRWQDQATAWHHSQSRTAGQLKCTMVSLICYNDIIWYGVVLFCDVMMAYDILCSHVATRCCKYLCTYAVLLLPVIRDVEG